MTEILIIRVKHSDQGIGVLLESSVELKESFSYIQKPLLSEKNWNDRQF